MTTKKIVLGAKTRELRYRVSPRGIELDLDSLSKSEKVKRQMKYAKKLAGSY